MAQSIEKEGRVKSTNAYGFKMEGSEDYFDYSKQNEVEHATKGETVRVKVSPKDDGKWWVNQLEVIASQSGPAAATNGHTPAPTTDDRNLSIVRQSSLKAAVEFYGMVSHDATECGKASEHVLALAAKFEEWVNR